MSIFRKIWTHLFGGIGGFASTGNRRPPATDLLDCIADTRHVIEDYDCSNAATDYLLRCRELGYEARMIIIWPDWGDDRHALVEVSGLFVDVWNNRWADDPSEYGTIETVGFVPPNGWGWNAGFTGFTYPRHGGHWIGAPRSHAPEWVHQRWNRVISNG